MADPDAQEPRPAGDAAAPPADEERAAQGAAPASDAPVAGRDAGDAAPAVAYGPTVRHAGGGAGRRLVTAFVLAPWLVGYGITGSWAVTRGVSGAARHLQQIDAGYTHPVSPVGLIAVGALLLAGFAALLATALLLLLASRRRSAWTAALIVAAALLAGALWAGIAGHISPGLWTLYFFGLVFAALVDVLALARVSRGARRATMTGS